ncbi:hypothetical protein J4456_05210 [Candidatus Pacearchaeota archaeon]|nr:hypothetical protein [Candidatus Pacearchaeota archaeon]
MTTTIQISDDVKRTLEKMRIFERETYNEIIENMLEDQMEINDKTKKELSERKNSKNFITQGDVEKEFGI